MNSIEQKEDIKMALDRANKAALLGDISAVVVAIIHDSDNDEHKMEIISCGRESIIRTLKNRLGFSKSYDVPIGRNM